MFQRKMAFTPNAIQNFHAHQSILLQVCLSNQNFENNWQNHIERECDKFFGAADATQ